MTSLRLLNCLILSSLSECANYALYASRRRGNLKYSQPQTRQERFSSLARALLPFQRRLVGRSPATRTLRSSPPVASGRPTTRTRRCAAAWWGAGSSASSWRWRRRMARGRWWGYCRRPGEGGKMGVGEFPSQNCCVGPRAAYLVLQRSAGVGHCFSSCMLLHVHA